MCSSQNSNTLQEHFIATCREPIVVSLGHSSLWTAKYNIKDLTDKRVPAAKSRTSEWLIRLTEIPYWAFTYHFYIQCMYSSQKQQHPSRAFYVMSTCSELIILSLWQVFELLSIIIKECHNVIRKWYCILHNYWLQWGRHEDLSTPKSVNPPRPLGRGEYHF